MATGKIGLIEKFVLRRQGAADADISAFENAGTGEKITSYVSDPDLRSISVFMINEMRKLDCECGEFFEKSKCRYTVPSEKKKKGKRKRATYQAALADLTNLIEENKDSVSLSFFTYSQLLDSVTEASEAMGDIGQRPEIKAMHDMKRAQLRREYAIPANKNRENALSLSDEKIRILNLLINNTSSRLKYHMNRIGIYYKAAQRSDPALPVKCVNAGVLLNESGIDMFSFYTQELEKAEAIKKELLKLEKERKADSNEV